MARQPGPVADPVADVLRRARNLWRGVALAAGVAAVAAVTVSLGVQGELEGKRTEMKGWKGPREARDIIRRSRERYQEVHPELKAV